MIICIDRVREKEDKFLDSIYKSDSNNLYYKLIKSFGDITGVYVLLNTSFNIQEPIVYTPDDAINTSFYAQGDLNLDVRTTKSLSVYIYRA